MIQIRSIRADEAAWFSALGPDDVGSLLEESWSDGTSRPEWSLVAEADGVPIARSALVAEPMGGGVDTLEGTAAFLWADLAHPQHADAVRTLLDALADDLAPYGPTTLDRRLNLELHADVGPMRVLLENAGFRLFQEKVGFTWSPSATPRPGPLQLRRLTLADVGRAAFLRVMAATTADTLDRNDQYYIARCGPGPWAEEIMRAVDEGHEESWLVGHHGDEPAGFVGVSRFDEDTWTIAHIGVVPEHRGHGHVHELLAAADDAARARGFAAGLSDVDVENGPMLAAMERAGHEAGVRPWHIWHYRRAVPAGPVRSERG